MLGGITATTQLEIGFTAYFFKCQERRNPAPEVSKLTISIKYDVYSTN